MATVTTSGIGDFEAGSDACFLPLSGWNIFPFTPYS
jgi:hypothetical protein